MKFHDDQLKNPVVHTFESNRIGLPTDEGISMVLCRDILRCEADKSQCRFYLVNGEVMTVKRNIGFYEDKLSEWNFFKIHKSHLVNLQHVEEFVDGDEEICVILSDKSTVPV